MSNAARKARKNLLKANRKVAELNSNRTKVGKAAREYIDQLTFVHPVKEGTPFLKRSPVARVYYKGQYMGYSDYSGNQRIKLAGYAVTSQFGAVEH